MQFLKSKFLIIFLFFYLIFGSLASIKSGISFDENYEEINWKFNVKVAKNLSDHFFFNKTYDEKIQEKYIGYGIGFSKENIWMHLKLACVILLVIYHLYCGFLLRKFISIKCKKSHIWFRWFNEIPVLILFATTVLVVVKPF